MASSSKLPAGVVWGDNYKTLIAACKEGGYALPAVNVVGTSSINAVLEAAAKTKSDVIVQLSNGGAEFYAGAGSPDKNQARVLGAVSAALHVHTVAKLYGICVVLHTDHANKKLLPWVDALIEKSAESVKKNGHPLYSSHMLDLSEESLEENVATSATFLKKLAPLGMSLEIELGVTGGEEDGVGAAHDNADNPKLYTQPEHVLYAYEKLQPIGHFSIAASFGNVHGVYAPGNVKLRPEILRGSQELVQQKHKLNKNPLDLVFHGGSGSEKSKIHESLTYGIFKMNIDTDTQFAYSQPVGEYVEKNARAFKYQIDPETHQPYKKEYDPRKWQRKGEEGVVNRLIEAFEDLKSKGKSLASN